MQEGKEANTALESALASALGAVSQEVMPKCCLQAFDSIVTSKDDEGNGFQLLNNTVGYNRGRG